MKKVVISGDVVASTSLEGKDRGLLEESLNRMFSELKEQFDFFSRVIKGDYLELVPEDPFQGLEIALAIKAWIKGYAIEEIENLETRRQKLFKTHGIRLALGYGDLDRFDVKKGIIDGEAIYLSGRRLSQESTYKKERAVIKNTLFFTSSNDEISFHMEPVIEFLDVLFTKATSRQCQVLFQTLLGNSEKNAAETLKIKQPVVNQHLTTAGWNAIDKSIEYYKALIK